MITLNATCIWQWDTGHTVTVDGADAVHFAMNGDDTALVVTPTKSGSTYTANVPNILLQRDGVLCCWRVVGGISEQMTRIVVKPKPKPADYVYEETAVEDYAAIKKWFTDSVEELQADYNAAIAEVEEKTQAADVATGRANAAAASAESAIAAMNGNILRGTVGPSEVVSADDAYAQTPLGVKVYGNTRQNLWVNPSGTSKGITVTDNDDGSLTISGESTGTSAVVKGKIYALAPGKTYTVSIDGAISEAITGSVIVNQRDSSGGNLGSTVYFGYAGILTKTFITDDSLSYVEFQVYCDANRGAQLNQGTYRVMLNEGSEAQPWCPPGLNSVESLSVVTAGKNLLKPVDDVPGSVRAVVVKSNGNTYSFHGTPNGSGGRDIIFAQVTLIPGDYTFSRSKLDANVVAVINDMKDISAIKSLSGYSDIIHLDEVTEIGLGFNFYEGRTVDLDGLQIQLELGSPVTEYETSNVNVVPIDLQGNELCGLPDGTKDTIDFATGSIDRKVITKVIDGVNIKTYETGKRDGSLRWFRFNNFTDRRDSSGGPDSWMNNKFAKENHNQSNDVASPVMSFNPTDLYAANLYIWPPDGTAETIEEFDEWLKNNPITIMYALKNDEVVQLTPAELPALPAPNLTAYADADVLCEIELEYARDVNIAYDKLVQAITATAANI